MRVSFLVSDGILKDVQMTVLIVILSFCVISFIFLNYIKKLINTDDTSSALLNETKKISHQTERLMLKQYNSSSSTPHSSFYLKNRSKYFNILLHVENIVKNSTIAVWNNEMSDYSGIITMNKIKHFLSQRAVEHLAFISDNNHNTVDSMLTIDECCLMARQAKIQRAYLMLFSNGLYNILIQAVIMAHILLAFLEPSTPKMLEENKGWDNNVLIYSLVCIGVEWIDLIVQFSIRFIRFNARNYGLEMLNHGHKASFTLHSIRSLHNNGRRESNSCCSNCFDCSKTDNVWIKVFVGHDCQRFILLIVCNMLIAVNVGLTYVYYIGIFSYYIPIVPILLIVRNDNIYVAMTNFLNALSYGGDVLLTFFSYVIICSSIGMALFSEKLNVSNIVNSYVHLIESITTTFILVATEENYNELIYPGIELNIFYVFYFLLLIMIGIFFFNPVLISRFEQAYRRAKKKEEKNKIEGKINAIICAFVDLDLDGNHCIDKQECENLLHYFTHFSVDVDSMDSVSLWKRFSSLTKVNNNDDANSNKNGKSDENSEISIDEFVNGMLDENMVSNISFEANEKKSGMCCNCCCSPKCCGNNDSDHNGDSRCSRLAFWCCCCGDLIKSCLISNNKLRAYLECNFFRNDLSRWIVLLFGIFPGLIASFLYDLYGVSSQLLNLILVACYILNVFEILIKIYAFGWKRYFNFYRYPDSPYLEASTMFWRIKHKLNNVHHFIFLSKSTMNWVKKNLRCCHPLSVWDRKQLTMVFRLDFFIVLVSTCGILYVHFFVNSLAIYSINSINSIESIDSIRPWLLIILIRIFTLILINRKLIFEIVSVVGDIVSLLALMILYIFIWSRIGITLFKDKADVIIDTIYDASVDATFDTLIESILALIQLIVGEGWHEVMYTYVISTSYVTILYFILYIFVGTLLLKNIFIGLVLAGMQDLKNKMSHDEIYNKWMDGKETEFHTSVESKKQQLINEISKKEIQLREIQTLEEKKFQSLKTTRSISSV